MGLVRNIYALDSASAALAADALPTTHLVRFERTDCDLFPKPLFQREVRPSDPALPSTGEPFEAFSWGLQEALDSRSGSFFVQDVADSAYLVAGALVIEHAVGVRQYTWLDEREQ